MCFNKTTNILYDCENNLDYKTLLIFIFSGLIMLLSFIFTIIFFISKPVWLDYELERIRNNEII